VRTQTLACHDAPYPLHPTYLTCNTTSCPLECISRDPLTLAKSIVPAVRFMLARVRQLTLLGRLMDKRTFVVRGRQTRHRGDGCGGCRAVLSSMSHTTDVRVCWGACVWLQRMLKELRPKELQSPTTVFTIVFIARNVCFFGAALGTCSLWWLTIVMHDGVLCVLAGCNTPS